MAPTLTAALTSALADPPDLEPLRSLEPPPDAVAPNPILALAVLLLRYCLRDYAADRLDRMADHTMVAGAWLVRGGASTDDVADLFAGHPREASWKDAAMRVAAWVDAQPEPT